MRVMIVGLLTLLTAGQVIAEIIATEVLPSLNQPVSNNAVTLIATEWRQQGTAITV